MYYILGFTEDGKVNLMSRKVFITYNEAVKYKATIHPNWKPFIVKQVGRMPK